MAETGATATVGLIIGGDMISVFGRVPEVGGRTSLNAGDVPESICCRRRRSSGDNKETDLAISSKREDSAEESTPSLTGVPCRCGGDDLDVISQWPKEMLDGVLGDVLIGGRLSLEWLDEGLCRGDEPEACNDEDER